LYFLAQKILQRPVLSAMARFAWRKCNRVAAQQALQACAEHGEAQEPAGA